MRDKIPASKKKGIWMGGTVPLGYDVKDRKLVPNHTEARIVVDIFWRYLRLKSVRALAEELATAGIKSKRRVRPDGTEYGHQRFSHGALYLLLQNRTYRGEITHKGTLHVTFERFAPAIRVRRNTRCRKRAQKFRPKGSYG